MRKQLIVIGAGPGGYVAAFTAADLGLNVTLIDDGQNPGGVCLYRGCIPSKALLHIAQGSLESREAKELGVEFGEPRIDLDRVREFKSQVVSKLTGGLGQLAKQRKIEFIQGRAKFLSSNSVEVQKADGSKETLEFDHAILATGSLPITLPFAPRSERVLDSTSALELRNIPGRLLVIGGGYIGLELGTVYRALGSEVSVVEMTPSLLPGADKDLALTLSKRLQGQFKSIKLNTKVTAISETPNAVSVSFEDKNGQVLTEEFDKVLIAIGRKNVYDGLGLDNTKIQFSDDKKFIKVNAQRQTTDPSIYAIGDIAGQPMLAHKASAEGKVAAEAIAGHKAGFDVKAIPAVVFTDPEIAWCGITEAEAKDKGLNVTVSKFPWAASGRAVTLNRTEGLTKVIADADTGRILGVAMAGVGAGEMISEGVLAVELGALASDVALSVHPHPTISETFMEAAEGIIGQATHIYRPKRSL